MGIRFRCHHCEHELNLKEFQAGRRARCPACSGRFRVPTASTEFSLALDENEVMVGSSTPAVGAQAAKESAVAPIKNRSANFELSQPANDPEAQLHARLAQSRRTGHGSRGSDQATKVTTLETPGGVPNSDNPSSALPKAIAMPKAIVEAPQAVWYVRPPTGGQYGPADGSLFHQWLIDNRVSPDSLVWRDGWPQWQAAGDAFQDYFGTAWRLADPAPELSSPAVQSVAPGDLTVRESIGTVSDYRPVDPATLTADSVASPALDNEGLSAPGDAGEGLSAESLAVSQLRHPKSFTEVQNPATSNLSVAEIRRRKQRSQYAIMIGILSLLAVVLLIVFIMVIVNNAK